MPDEYIVSRIGEIVGFIQDALGFFTLPVDSDSYAKIVERIATADLTIDEESYTEAFKAWVVPELAQRNLAEYQRQLQFQLHQDFPFGKIQPDRVFIIQFYEQISMDVKMISLFGI